MERDPHMGWYDFFSQFYDASLERLYRSSRGELGRSLHHGVGSTLVDVACGTGQNFAVLAERVGPPGRVIGVDASAGMVERARRRIGRSGWGNFSAHEIDARKLSIGALTSAAGAIESRGVDCVVCALGLSVVPEWELVFERSFELLRPGGQFVILDVHAEKRVLQTRWVELVARADLSRKVWEPLERSSERFELRYLVGSPRVFGGRLFLATGFRV